MSQVLDAVPARQAAWIYVTLVACTQYACIAVYGWFRRVPAYFDYAQYLMLAGANPQDAVQPFANRIAAPLLARGLDQLTAWGPQASLMTVVFAGWALVGPVLGLYLRRRGVPLRWALALASVPFPALSASYVLVPDSWSVLAVLLVLLALHERRPLLGALATAILALSRVTSLAVLLPWALVTARAHGLRLVLALAAGAILGLLLLTQWRVAGADNAHSMQAGAYYLLKAPVNLVRNVLGMPVFVNDTAPCAEPLAVIDLAGTPGMGAVQQVGFCPPLLDQALDTLLLYALVFGLFPLAIAVGMLRQWRRARQVDARELVYLLVFLASAGMGTTVPRLFVESYPYLLAVAATSLSARFAQAGVPWPFYAFNLAGLLLLVPRV